MAKLSYSQLDRFFVILSEAGIKRLVLLSQKEGFPEEVLRQIEEIVEEKINCVCVYE